LKNRTCLTVFKVNRRFAEPKFLNENESALSRIVSILFKVFLLLDVVDEFSLEILQLSKYCHAVRHLTCQ